MENNNRDYTQYYKQKLDENPETGYLFTLMKLPNLHNGAFMLLTLFLFSLIEVAFHYHFIFLITGMAICWEHYMVHNRREKILENCLVEEVIMEEEFKRLGTDPNFPEDPAHVTDEDRDYFFRQAICVCKTPKLFYQIKHHYIHIILVTCLSLGFYSLSGLIMQMLHY